MPFRSDLNMRWITAGSYMLLSDLVYAGRRDLIVIPAGFRTDLASVPRIVRWLLPQDGRWTRAAIVHDWCCRHPEQFTARDADGLFRRVCREEGVPVLARRLLWTGVRLGALTDNPHRRIGWWWDAPVVIGVTMIGAILVVPASLVVLAALALYALAEAAATATLAITTKDRK